MANFLDQFTGNIQKRAADQEVGGLRAGMTDYGQYADLGRGALGTNYAQATQQYLGLQPGSTGAYNAYLDATGANGAEGLQRANAQYLQASPGFAGAADLAAKTAARAGVAGGQATGNTLAEIQRRVTQMQADRFGDYASRLGYAPGLAQNLAGGAAGTYTGLGGALGQSYGNQASTFFGANKDIGAAQAKGTMGELTGLQNFTNLALNVGKLGVGAMTGGIGSGLMDMAGGLMGRTQVGSSTMPNQPAPNQSYWSPNGMGGYSPTYGT